MSKTADPDFANVLMDTLRRDCDRYSQGPEWGPIVLWMAEEVQRQSSSLDLPREIVRQMTMLATEARTLVYRI